MGTLYWSIVVVAVGACVGSFLNVLIYRWPRGLSVRRPSRSFCPNCEATIGWQDNLPVVSYLVLRGRCRRCQARISPQYPLVELATALLFLMTYDTFFVARMRLGIGDPLDDWPMLIAHWLLWSGMIALAVMDLEAYVVDINLTWVVSGVGIVGHLLWTPASSAAWNRPGPEAAALAVAAAIGLGIGMALFSKKLPVDEEIPLEQEEPAEQMAAKPSRLWPLVLIPAAVLALYVAFLALAPQTSAAVLRPHLELIDGWRLGWDRVDISSGSVRLLVALGVVFLGLSAVASQPNPEADAEIDEAVMDEAPQSRRQALLEAKLIAPAVIGGVLALLLLNNEEAYRAAERILHWNPVGDWQPLWGLTTGLVGWLLGGAIGWLTRIIGTLVFGKEALGMGDVHILAAAGAVAGWTVALLGFMLAAPITLLALVVISLRRQSRMLPYGPWLAFGFLVAFVFQDSLLAALGLR